MGYAIVFLGGGIGAALRHGVNLGAARWLGAGFPFGTLIVNVTGSLIMGLIAGYFAFKGDASQNWRLFLVDRHPRRLHHILRLFARRRAAL